MKTFDYVIQDNDGIHARPAGELTKLCKTFSSLIQISKDDKTVKATKILGIMSLGATKGSTVTLSFEGDDEEEACAAVKDFLEKNL